MQVGRQQVRASDDAREVQGRRRREIGLGAGQRRERWQFIEHVVDDEPYGECLRHIVGNRRIDQPPGRHAEVILGRGRVLVVEIDAADEYALPIPRHWPINVVYVDASLALGDPGGIGEFAREVIRACRADLRQQPLRIEVVDASFHAAECARQIERIVESHGHALEFEQSRIDIAHVEVRDLPGRVPRERLARRVVRVVARVVAGVQNLHQRQGLDGLRELDVDIVDRKAKLGHPARPQHDADGSRIGDLALQVFVA